MTTKPSARTRTNSRLLRLRRIVPVAIALVVTVFTIDKLRSPSPAARHDELVARVTLPNASPLNSVLPNTPATRPARPDKQSPELAPCPARARACVDTRHKLAWLQRNGQVTYGPVPVGLGRPGHRTPKGIWQVAYKGPHMVSTEYGIPMPWAVFFAYNGIAFHQGPLDVASHGCVHLRPKDARKFYDVLQPGDVVSVR